MTENIQHIRLINGDEIIGDIINETEYTMVVDCPMIVEERTDKAGSTGIVLNKFVPFAKQNVCVFLKSHIICSSDLNDVVKRYYYNSLLFSNKLTDRMIRDLEFVNTLMETQYNPDDQQPASSGSNFVKGTDTIN
jgi:hypothetical protein